MCCSRAAYHQAQMVKLVLTFKRSQAHCTKFANPPEIPPPSSLRFSRSATPEAQAALSEAEALRRQLVGREQMRAAADRLERNPHLGREVFARGRPEGRSENRGAASTDLLRACLTLLQVPAEMVAVYRPRPPPFWRVSQAIARIRTMLLEQPEGAALMAFLPAIEAQAPDREVRYRAAVASTLVAELELARAGGVVVGRFP